MADDIPSAEFVNQLKPQYLSILSLNPWAAHTSSSRGVMFAGHLGQALVIKGATPRFCQSGAEREFGKYTFSTKLPVDANIIRVIPKYNTRKVGAGVIRQNPMDTIIYENIHTKEVNVIHLMQYSTSRDSLHQHFGFRYKTNKHVYSQLSAGAHFPKGTILADSPSKDDEGNYCYGVETEVALMSIPGVIEDGVIVSESYIQKITATGFEKRVVSWGKEYYPLNLYGDRDNYKPFPDIGDRIRDDGLLFALRKFDPLLDPIKMRPDRLEEPDYIFDKTTYAKPGARVVDITVHHDDTQRTPPTPVGMEVQAEKYLTQHKEYYRTLWSVYEDLLKKRGRHLRISEELQNLLVESMAHTVDPAQYRVTKTYRRNPLDDYRVEVAFEYDVVPTVGAKLTGTHGNKGVICAIWPDAKMPVDADGNRAELIMDADSIIKRMNLGCPYEQYINAARRDHTKRLREMVGLDRDGFSSLEQARRALMGPNAEKAWESYMAFCDVVSPRMSNLWRSGRYKGDRMEHLAKVLQASIHLNIPTDNPVRPTTMLRQLEEHFPPTYGPVTYDGVTTEDRVLIGSNYIMILEKTGGEWSGVGSAKLQHFGLPARVTNADKYAAPGRGQPVRITGEGEIRLLNATSGPGVSADIMDQSNNPRVHREINRHILTTPTPTRIERIIDREKFPIGNSRALVFVKHVMECSGSKFVRVDDDDGKGD